MSKMEDASILSRPFMSFGVFDVAQSRVSYDVLAMRLAGVLDRTL
jgi:hypothetical protein